MYKILVENVSGVDSREEKRFLKLLNFQRDLNEQKMSEVSFLLSINALLPP